MKKQLLKKLYAFIVTAMLFSASANAQIVYADVNPDKVLSLINNLGSLDYNIDLNNDSISDYKITVSRSSFRCSRFGSFGTRSYILVTALNSNTVVKDTNVNNPLAMNFNDSISSGVTFSNSGYLRLVSSGPNCNSTSGVWPNLIDRYLGLKLIVGPNTYYGWARMQINISNPTSCTIKDYAYNSIPNQPINAGETIATGILENSFASSINLFPNPADNHFTITLGSNNKKVEVTITDIAGKVIYSTTADETNEIKVNTKEFAEGIYIVQIQAAGFIGTKKLIVKK